MLQMKKISLNQFVKEDLTEDKDGETKIKMISVLIT